MATRYTHGGYLARNPEWHVDGSPWKAAQVLTVLNRNGLAPARVCEVGCGAGEILAQLQRYLPKSAALEGYDISPQAIEMASLRANDSLTFHVADFLAADTPQYDLILVIDVLEHLEDYFTFLRQLRRRATWKLFHIPLDISVQTLARVRPLLAARQSVGHLHYFFKEQALAVLNETGYDVIDVGYTPGLVDRAKTRPQRMLRPLRRALYACSRDGAARVLGGYSLIVLAR